ncbi:MAG: glycosyltransferase family 2 protein [Wenzhouxiangella sp.]
MSCRAARFGPGFRSPVVSVITPVFNGATWLGEALDSALAQTFPSIEIIVVNDGSTDDSLAIARSRADNCEKIRIIDQPNAGLPAARNRALKLARGAYLALLDADDAWFPNHLLLAMKAFEDDPDLGLVHSNIQRVDADGAVVDIPPRCWHEDMDAFEALALRHEHVSCPTAVFSRTALDTVGGFDPRFTGLGCEDRDLWLRIAERFRIRYLDQVTARYRLHPASMSAAGERMALARQMLVAKLAESARGARLVSRMEAMIESDLGLSLSEQGRHIQAIARQWAALRQVPTDRLIQRRFIGSLLAPCRSLTPRYLPNAFRGRG